MKDSNGLMRLKLFNRIDRILGSSYELKTVIRKIFDEIAKVLDTRASFIALYNPDTRVISFEIFKDSGREMYKAPQVVSQGLTGYVIRTRKPLLLNKDIKGFCKTNNIALIITGKPVKSLIIVPMVHRNRVEGLISIQNNEKENAYTQEDFELLKNIATRAAVVVANTRLIEEEMRRANELEMLNRVVHRLTRSLDIMEICDSVTRSILEYFKNFNIAVFLKEGNELVLKKLSRGFRDEVPRDLRIKFGQGIVGTVAKTGSRIVANDVSLNKHYISFGQTPTKSEVAIPLKIKDTTSEILIGVLDIQCNTLNAFDENTVRILELIGDRLSVAFHNAKLYEDAVAHSRELSVSLKIAQSLVSSLELVDVLNQILEVIRRNFGYENCAILLVDKKTNELYIKASRGYPEYLAKKIRLDISKKEGITSYVAATGKPFYTPDVRKTPFYVMGKRSIRSEAAVPLILRDEVIGVLDIESDKPNAFSERDIERFTIFASQAAVAIENARLYDQTREMSLTDSLTKIANRRHFDLILENELKRGRGYSRSVSLAMIDLDHFKEFNDRYGHPAGDQLLTAVAERLKRTVRDTDLVARYGGEEFVIIFPETGAAPAYKVCERVRVAVENMKILIDNQEVSTTVSIGVATYPQSAQSAAELIQKADMALYRAKKLGRNRVEGI